MKALLKVQRGKATDDIPPQYILIANYSILQQHCRGNMIGSGTATH